MINLKQYNPQLQQFDGGSNPIYMIEIDKTKFVFKETNKESEKMHITEPLISQYLAESPCERFVPYYSAKYNDKVGVLSKYFLEDNEQEIKYLDILEFLYYNQQNNKKDLNYKFSKEEFDIFNNAYEEKRNKMCFNHSVKEITENVKKFCDLYKINLDLLKLQKSLTETVIYDYFLGNEDRNWQNLSFIINNNNKKPQLSQSPMYDHEFCLNMYYYYDKYIHREAKKFNNDCNYHISLRPHYLSEIERDPSLNSQKIMIKDIIAEASKNKDVQKQIQYCLNFNAEKFINKFEKDEKIIIDDEHKEIITYVFNSKIKSYKKLEQELKNNMEK